MRPPFAYYGGKTNMVNNILPLIPRHKQYVEPFSGGLAVFFAKDKSAHEVINDLDDRVINFYKVCQNDFHALQALIKQTLHSESEHKRAKELLTTGTDLERAWALWVQTNMSFSNGIGKGFAFSNLNDDRKNREVLATKNKRNSFTDKYCERLQDVTIMCRDALDVIKRFDTDYTFFYLDPPYVSSDCGHYKGYSLDDFKALLDLLPTLKGKWLLSSYPENLLLEYREKYGWNSKDITQVLSVSGKHNSGKSKTECLTWNYELTHGQQSLF